MTASRAEAPPGPGLAPDPVPGSRLGRYELVRRLAIGGMAELYLARTGGVGDFNKLVALKRILPQLAATEDFRRMFLDEARLAATLHHPNVAQVFDVGSEGDELFFAMEYVDGQDLGRVMRAAAARGVAMPLEVAVGIVMGVAAGLHYAHERTDERGQPLHIVHRDVSPANVLVGKDGAVKLVDFGIAKAASQRTLTRQGLLKGKVAYMSPEQCMSRPIDRRSDVFALGILLYELTTGTTLYAGESDYAILHQIADVDVPRPSSRAAGYPPALEQIVLAALRRDPAARIPTAEALQLDLETFARQNDLVTSAIEIARFMRELGLDTPGADTETERAEAPPLRWRGDGNVRALDLAQPDGGGAGRSRSSAPGPASPAQPRTVPRRFAFGAAAASALGTVGLFLWWRKRPGPAAASEGLERLHARPVPASAATTPRPVERAPVAEPSSGPAAEPIAAPASVPAQEAASAPVAARAEAPARPAVKGPAPRAAARRAKRTRATLKPPAHPAPTPAAPAPGAPKVTPAKRPVDLDAPFPPF
jgi:serine/threonine protein kinase